MDDAHFPTPAGVSVDVAAAVPAVSVIVVRPVVGSAQPDEVGEVGVPAEAVGVQVVDLQLSHRPAAAFPRAHPLEGEQRNALVHVCKPRAAEGDRQPSYRVQLEYEIVAGGTEAQQLRWGELDSGVGLELGGGVRLFKVFRGERQDD